MNYIFYKYVFIMYIFFLKRFLALQLMKKAYALGAISDRSIPLVMNKNKTHREGLEAIAESIALYTEVCMSS